MTKSNRNNARVPVWPLALVLTLACTNTPIKAAFYPSQPHQQHASHPASHQPSISFVNPRIHSQYQNEMTGSSSLAVPRSHGRDSRTTQFLSSKNNAKRNQRAAAAAAAAAADVVEPTQPTTTTSNTTDLSTTNINSDLEKKKQPLKTYSGRFLEDNGIRLSTDDQGQVRATRASIPKDARSLVEQNKNDTEIYNPKDDNEEALTLKKEEQEETTKNTETEKEREVVEPKINNIQRINQREDTDNNARQNKSTNDKITNKKNEATSTIFTDKSSTVEAPTIIKKKSSKKEQNVVDDDDNDSSKGVLLPPPPKPQNTASIFKRAPAKKESLKEQPAKVVPTSGFNVVLTHCTADFDSLASAVGLAKLWASTHCDPAPSSSSQSMSAGYPNDNDDKTKKHFDSTSDVPTFVVLPRGAHPGVQRFLSLHKHLFPIRSLRSLPDDLTGLNRLGLVDAQRRDRIGPAENLLQYAKRVTVVDHHIDSETDIPEATDYVVDKVGSVSTLIAERLQQANLELTEAEATLLALGIHADTGSLCYDSTTPRDAMALAWVMSQGASQAAIAEHAQSSLSPEQQGVLTQALINTNSTVIHGVTLSTVLLSADGFINGLAAVTQDAMELSSSDVFLLAVVYEAQSGSKRRSKGNSSNIRKRNQGERLTSRLLHRIEEHAPAFRRIINVENADRRNNITLGNKPNPMHNYTAEEMAQAQTMFAEAWRGGEIAMRRRRLQAAFDRTDLDSSGYLEKHEFATTLAASGIIASEESIRELMNAIDTDGDGKVNFEEFVTFALDAEQRHEEDGTNNGSRPSTMIIIGRVKAGVNMKAVKLNRLFERFGGGGHAKAASATVRLSDESEAEGILQGLVDEIISTSLQEQVTVGDFMTAPVLSVKPHMTEKQVEDLFTRYDVRALPVVDDENDVIGLVTYKEVAAAKQRLWNKEQKRLRREKEAAENGEKIPYDENKAKERQGKAGSTVKGWMKQHVRLVEESTTMAELEAILLESDVGCIPVVADGTKKLIGMVTRTDLLRQHRYYPSLHYHNKGFADSISARKPIIELRKRLKKFDLENE